jgi:hypothetical protein
LSVLTLKAVQRLKLFENRALGTVFGHERGNNRRVGVIT